MKKNYPFIMMALFMPGLLYAQCSVQNIIITNNYSIAAGPDSCDINFDIAFSSENNNGNKRIFIHLWETSSYPGLAYSGTPTAAQLAGSLGTIHIENPGATATLDPTYPLPGVKVLYTGLTLQVNAVPTPDLYVVKNVTVRVPRTGATCASQVDVKGDIWSTQNNSNNPSCTQVGFQFVVNNPFGTLDINCFTPSIPDDPQTYDLTITTNTTNPPGLSVSFTVWIDDGDNTFDAGTDIQVGATNGPYTVSNTMPASFIDVPYLQQSDPNFNTYKDRTLWAVITVTDFPNLILSQAPNGCTILPVKLASFSAVRKGRDVKIEWKTIQELNNAGFTLERISHDGTVETVAKVPSKAVNGNSNTPITYGFDHLNPTSSATQYRLKQSGKDGAVEYSDIKTVNGMDAVKSITVYPNPVNGKTFRVYFDNATMEKQISLVDNTGRTVQRLSSRNASQAEINVLVPGVYHVVVFMPSTGQRFVEKIVVSH